MKRFTFLSLLLLMVNVAASAQCAMCRATLENNFSNGKPGIAAGLNVGILYLLVMPYLAVTVLGYLWYKSSKANGKRTYLAALLQGKCPRCRQGDIFTYPAHNLTRFNRMNERCPHCEVRLEPEPGFYQGAMYVGYAITIGCIAMISIPLFLIWNPSDWIYISAIISVMVLIIPLNYRYSRIIYLYFFGGIKYLPEFS